MREGGKDDLQHTVAAISAIKQQHHVRVLQSIVRSCCSTSVECCDMRAPKLMYSMAKYSKGTAKSRLLEV